MLLKYTPSPALLTTLVALFVVTASNQKLFNELSNRLNLLSWEAGGFVLTLFVLIVALLAIPLLLFPRLLLKPVLVAVLLLAAVLSYFTDTLGVIFNTDMIRNTLETVRDNNIQEAHELLSTSLLIHITLYGILPGIVVALIPVKYYRTWWRSLIVRVGYALVLALITTGLFVINNQYATFFSRENKELKAYITPLFAIHSTYDYLSTLSGAKKQPFITLGTDAHQQKQDNRRTIGIMVVGETARADHFSLNGYHRPTNPHLSSQKLISFANVESCGTSTAYSVPCMFSFLQKHQYSPEQADRQSNVLDVLRYAGVKVVWLDNNSSCKGVCKRIETVNLTQTPDKQNAFYNDDGYFDEVMLEDLSHYLDGNQDVLIVLHTLGSHGPKYHKRYPSDFARFHPYCQDESPHTCSPDTVINAYDNTILYTDHLLNRTINWLKSLEQDTDTFLLYASDHGESLGENGIYLHGLPNFLAPEAQTHIPMLLWLSQNYQERHPQAWTTLQSKTQNPLSHDNLSHSLLGFYSVQTGLYEPEYDLLQ